MTALAILAALLALGFAVEELPDLLVRQRLAREAAATKVARSRAAYGLAIEAHWHAMAKAGITCDCVECQICPAAVAEMIDSV